MYKKMQVSEQQFDKERDKRNRRKGAVSEKCEDKGSGGKVRAQCHRGNRNSTGVSFLSIMHLCLNSC